MPENTRPPSGMRDFLPADVRRREAVVRVVREVYEAHGFEPLETPTLERLDVLLGKYGDEGDKLLYSVAQRADALTDHLNGVWYELVGTSRAVNDQMVALLASERPIVGSSAPVTTADAADPSASDSWRAEDHTVLGSRPRAGDRLPAPSGSAMSRRICDLALRYDLTVPLARVVAEYQSKLPRVFKRSQIQPVWRADRPQRGRYREFWQCDIDVCGSTSRTVEVEVLSAACEVLDRLGFADFQVAINHRAVLAGYGEAMGMSVTASRDLTVALDKLDKIGVDGVCRELTERGLGAIVPSVQAFIPSISGTNDERLAGTEAFLRGLGLPAPSGDAGLADLRHVLALADGSAAARRLVVDPTLARGLSYYTGTIFEIRAPGLSGSLGGGGRYDGLIGTFLGREVPACGFSLGLERILLLLEERGSTLGACAPADVMVGQFDASMAGTALALARELRAAGLRADVHCDATKIGKQFQDADARGIPCVALVGPGEAANGTVSLKWLKTGERGEVARGDAAAWIRARLGP